MLEQRNTRKQGDVGMGIAIGWFTTRGYTVAVPLTDSQDYDLVIDKEDKLLKVQVKTTRVKDKYGVYTLTLKVCGGNKSRSTVKHFNPSKVDFIFAVDGDLHMYLIPTTEVVAKSSLSLKV